MLKEFAPSLKEAATAGVRAFRTSKRKSRHIFVLKAMATNRDVNIPWPPPNGAQYEFFFIHRQINAAIIEEAMGEKFQNPRIPVALFHLMPKDDLKKCKAVGRKYGLPLVDDEQGKQKIEAILHEMKEANILKFHPPERWSIL